MLKSQKPESEAPVKYYAVIDTNVLVSAALKWKSVPGSIIDLAFNKVIVPLVNKEILEEYRSVLLRPNFTLQRKLSRISSMSLFLMHWIFLKNTWRNLCMPIPFRIPAYTGSFIFFPCTQDIRWCLLHTS